MTATVESCTETIAAALSATKIGKPVRSGSLTVFPLFGPAGAGEELLLLDEAIEADQAEVAEISEDGSVPEVLVVNHADQPILVPEGLLLTGAKQNRTLNVTVIVKAHGEELVPVSCVEQGRWHHTSQRFAATHYATPEVRACKNASVRRNRETRGEEQSDQALVWETVSACLNSAEVRSATHSLADIYEAGARPQEELVPAEELPPPALPEDASGVLVFAGKSCLGLDLYAAPRLCQRLWPRLRASYLVQGRGQAPASHAPDRRAARGMLNSLRRSVKPVRDWEDGRLSLEVKHARYAGSGCLYRGRLAHLSALALAQEE